MSRCYRFPPPGYTRSISTNDDDNDALIVSIKLQRENEKAISDRGRDKARSSSSSDKKDKKREKKEHKKHKEKEKSHHSTDGPLKEKQLSTLYEVAENKWSSRQNESEQLEKSSVTEEHGRPIDLHNASCSSDSTGNSSKRKRTCTPPSSIQSHGNGNILRIRLSSQKTEDQPSTSGFNGHNSTSFLDFQPCSGILKEEPSLKQKDDVQLPLDKNKMLNRATTPITGAMLQPVSMQEHKLLCLSDKIAPPLALAPKMAPPQLPVLVPKPVLAPPPQLPPVPVPKPVLAPPPPAALAAVMASLQPPPVLAPNPVLAPPRSLPAVAPAPVLASAPAPKEKLSSHEKKILKMQLKYKKLFENWVPPTLPRELVIDDDDDEYWLFGNKGGDEKPGKRVKPNDSVVKSDIIVPCASVALQPRANYLSDVSIYAMPFTIPF